MQNSVRRDWFYQLAAAFVFIAALILVHPSVEAGMNDDWSFIFTARDLALTGHLHYNGWSSPLIGFQAYWGAVFFKIFGFSFLAARASVWVMALLSIPVLWRVLRRIELTQEQALFGVLFFLLSPLVLPHVSTFMTDLPAFFLFAAALLCALEVWDSQSDRRALLWMGAAACCGLLSGSVRQIYWLTGICFLSVLGWSRFRSVRGRACALIGILFTVVFGAAASYWLAHQPYVPVDNTLQQLRTVSLREALHTAGGDVLRDFLGITLLCVPLTLPLAWMEVRKLPLWIHGLILIAAVVIPYRMAEPLPWLGNTLTNYGVIISGSLTVGQKPVILSDHLMLALAAVGLASMVYAVLNVIRCLRDSSSSGLRRFLMLTMPFLVIYTLVIAARSPVFGLFDRYMIPHLFVFGALLLACSARQFRDLSSVTLASGGIFMLYALATTHDYFAEARTKLKATEEVMRAGHDRNAIMSSLEFNSWTQLERSGHVNNEGVTFPANAYRQIDDCNGPDETQEWWRSMEPDLAARYVITLTPVAGLQPSEFAPVEYWRWLPPGKYRIYVETVAKGSPALTCKPDTGS